MTSSSAQSLVSLVDGEYEPLEPWWAYVLIGADGRRTYVGVALDVERRLAQHNGEEPGGARSTRAGRPWRIGGRVGPLNGRGDALSVEYRLKSLRGGVRLAVLARGSIERDPMAWQKIPKEHHPLFYAAMPGDTRAELKTMFGGIAVIVNGHMAAGLWADTVVVRLEPKAWATVAKKGGEPFVPMGRAVMKDMILLPKGTLNRKRAETTRWLQMAIDFTGTLPPKKKKKKAAPNKSAKKKTATKRGAPKKSAPKKSAPKKSATKKSATKKSASKKSASKKSASKKSASKKSAPKKSATKKSAPKKSAPKKSAPKKSASKKSAPKKSAPKKSAPKKSATKKSASKKSAPKKSASKKSASKKSASKKSAPKKSAPKKRASKKAATKKSATKKTATKKRASKQTAVKKTGAGKTSSAGQPRGSR